MNPLICAAVVAWLHANVPAIERPANPCFNNVITEFAADRITVTSWSVPFPFVVLLDQSGKIVAAGPLLVEHGPALPRPHSCSPHDPCGQSDFGHGSAAPPMAGAPPAPAEGKSK